MLRVCCFCDKVRDDAPDAMELWQERQGVASSGACAEAAILSYTCCRHCLEADPSASVFRARQSEPIGSLHDSHPRFRSPASARSWRHSVSRAAS
jgi:hypothetical protein